MCVDVFVYSTDDGRTFNIINDRINQAIIRKQNGLQKHPHISDKVHVMYYDSVHTFHCWRMTYQVKTLRVLTYVHIYVYMYYNILNSLV